MEYNKLESIILECYSGNCNAARLNYFEKETITINMVHLLHVDRRIIFFLYLLKTVADKFHILLRDP